MNFNRKYETMSQAWERRGVTSEQLKSVLLPNVSLDRPGGSLTITVALRPDILARIDNAREQLKADFPEISTYQRSFIEAASLILLDLLEEQGLIED